LHKPIILKVAAKAYPLETMLRIYFLQQWYDLSDAGTEDLFMTSISQEHSHK